MSHVSQMPLAAQTALSGAPVSQHGGGRAADVERREKLLNSCEYVELIGSVSPLDARILEEPLGSEQLELGAFYFLKTCKTTFKRVGRKEILKCKGFKKSGPIIVSRRRGENSVLRFRFRGVDHCQLQLQRYSSDPPFQNMMITTLAVLRPPPGEESPPRQGTQPPIEGPAATAPYNEHEWDEDGFFRVYVLHITKKSQTTDDPRAIEPASVDATAAEAAGQSPRAVRKPKGPLRPKRPMEHTPSALPAAAAAAPGASAATKRSLPQSAPGALSSAAAVANQLAYLGLPAVDLDGVAAAPEETDASGVASVYRLDEDAILQPLREAQHELVMLRAGHLALRALAAGEAPRAAALVGVMCVALAALESAAGAQPLASCVPRRPPGTVGDTAAGTAPLAPGAHPPPPHSALGGTALRPASLPFAASGPAGPLGPMGAVGGLGPAAALAPVGAAAAMAMHRGPIGMLVPPGIPPGIPPGVPPGIPPGVPPGIPPGIPPGGAIGARPSPPQTPAPRSGATGSTLSLPAASRSASSLLPPGGRGSAAQALTATLGEPVALAVRIGAAAHGGGGAMGPATPLPAAVMDGSLSAYAPHSTLSPSAHDPSASAGAAAALSTHAAPMSAASSPPPPAPLSPSGPDAPRSALSPHPTPPTSASAMDDDARALRLSLARVRLVLARAAMCAGMCATAFFHGFPLLQWALMESQRMAVSLALSQTADALVVLAEAKDADDDAVLAAVRPVLLAAAAVLASIVGHHAAVDGCLARLHDAGYVIDAICTRDEHAALSLGTPAAQHGCDFLPSGTPARSHTILSPPTGAPGAPRVREYARAGTPAAAAPPAVAAFVQLAAAVACMAARGHPVNVADRGLRRALAIALRTQCDGPVAAALVAAGLRHIAIPPGATPTDVAIAVGGVPEPWGAGGKGSGGGEAAAEATLAALLSGAPRPPHALGGPTLLLVGTARYYVAVSAYVYQQARVMLTECAELAALHHAAQAQGLPEEQALLALSVIPRLLLYTEFNEPYDTIYATFARLHDAFVGTKHLVIPALTPTFSAILAFLYYRMQDIEHFNEFYCETRDTVWAALVERRESRFADAGATIPILLVPAISTLIALVVDIIFTSSGPTLWPTATPAVAADLFQIVSLVRALTLRCSQPPLILTQKLQSLDVIVASYSDARDGRVDADSLALALSARKRKMRPPIASGLMTATRVIDHTSTPMPDVGGHDLAATGEPYARLNAGALFGASTQMDDTMPTVPFISGLANEPTPCRGGTLFADSATPVAFSGGLPTSATTAGLYAKGDDEDWKQPPSFLDG